MSLTYQSVLIKKYHTLASKLGMKDEEKRHFLSTNYGVESSKLLLESELKEVCELFSNTLNSEGDKWRKRVIAAVGKYLTNRNIEHDMIIIKAVACRAAGYDNFNKIPNSRLHDIYSEFVRKQQVQSRVSKFDQQITQHLTQLN